MGRVEVICRTSWLCDCAPPDALGVKSDGRCIADRPKAFPAQDRRRVPCLETRIMTMLMYGWNGLGQDGGGKEAACILPDGRGKAPVMPVDVHDRQHDIGLLRRAIEICSDTLASVDLGPRECASLREEIARLESMMMALILPDRPG
jgi:hypothetical protein